mmetsp:Transcript_20541/g.31173  ORF Transcript_20541/g.31173 Transcript_20541/m.31173 type:complete len:97 (-) Transcript_20541:251-541(-)
MQTKDKANQSKYPFLFAEFEGDTVSQNYSINRLVMFRKNKINSPTTSPPRSGGGASSVATPATNASNNTNTSTSSAVNSRSPIVNNILRYANKRQS